MEEQVVGGRNWKHSKELCNAIYDDWKHEAVDSAKKRAVVQNVDYPTFANLVSVAHLKPIERRKPGQDKENQEFYQSMAPAWSFNSSGTQPPLPCETSSNIDGKYFMGHGTTEEEKCTKYSADAFVKEWRNLGKDNPYAKLELLIRIAAPFELPDIFKVEVPPYLMADILETISTFLLEEKSSSHPTAELVSPRAKARDTLSGQVDVEWVTSLLEALPKCGRFPLAVRLMGERMRVKVQHLFEHLASSTWSHYMNAATSAEEAAIVSSPEHKQDPSIICRLQDLRATYSIDY